MEIASAVVNMSAQKYYTERNIKEENLRMWVGNERPDFDILDVSEEAKDLQIKENSGTEEIKQNLEISNEDKQKIYLLQKLLEALTGKKIKIQVLEKLPSLVSEPGSPSPDIMTAEPQKQGWGLEYDSVESHYEKEQVSFNAGGIIKTADGKEIDFSVTLNMSREFASEQRIQIRAGDAKLVDPLIINFEGTAAELTETKFSFDLDSDGTADQISFVTQNSGLLALDLNNDGKINNGHELFGPTSGNGFSELAGYDEDNNNWIDENDSIYDCLRIWTKDASGRDQLFTLGQKGIGAIFLGNIDTLFSLKDQQNVLQGQVVKSGIYVKEQGTVGTVQQIDLAV